MDEKHGESYDFAYLKETVGTPLAQALAQLALTQPEDPVEYVGKYLLKHVENVRRKEELKVLTQRQEAQQQSKSVANSERLLRMDVQRKQEQANQEDADLKSLLLTLEDIELVNQKILERVCERTGAASAYLGRKVINAEDEKEYVHWFSATKNSACVLGQKVSEENGVTFDVFKDIEDENAVPDEEGNLPPPAPPAYIHIENVIREPRMVYYGVPKLGAYVASFIKVKQYLHDEVMEEGADPGTLNTKEDIIVLAMDSMGQSRSFTPVNLLEYVKWKTFYVEVIEEVQHRIYNDEVEQKKAEVNSFAALTESILAKKTASEEKVQAALTSVSEEEKSLKETEIRLVAATELVLSFVNEIERMGKFQIPYKLPVLYACAAALALLGASFSDLFNPVSRLPDWNKIRLLLTKDYLMPTMDAYRPLIGVTESKGYLERTNAEEVAVLHPVVGVLYDWAQAAIASAEAIAEAAATVDATEE